MSTRYIEEFLNLRCAPDLLRFKVFPKNGITKEITECMGAFHALRDLLSAKSFARTDITVYVVGDGTTPRMGALLAHMTRWNVFSVDPRMRDETWTTIRGLTCIPKKIEDVEIQEGALTLVVGIHNHAPLEGVWNRIHGPKICIAIPCCVPQSVGRDPDQEYNDPGILSEKNHILIWKNL